jgi:hypothetical protein
MLATVLSTSNPESESDLPAPFSFGVGLGFNDIPLFMEATAKTGARSGARAFTTEAGLGLAVRMIPSSELRSVTGSGGSNGNGSGGESGGGDDSGDCGSSDEVGGCGGGPFRALNDPPGRGSISDRARRLRGSGVGLADP